MSRKTFKFYKIFIFNKTYRKFSKLWYNIKEKNNRKDWKIKI